MLPFGSDTQNRPSETITLFEWLVTTIEILVVRVPFQAIFGYVHYFYPVATEFDTMTGQHRRGV